LEEVVPFLGFSHPKGTPEGHNPFTLFPTVTNQALFRPAATKKFRKFYFERDFTEPCINPESGILPIANRERRSHIETVFNLLDASPEL